ncbi:MAG: gamma-glutamyltransferase [Anaerolineales bacterium]|nr:gamma-glutamyltransferase family protein [Anaerolineae bacterium]PWB52817.1 MAG: gamma-glutamyltransferase [Anaerolineales bacterium]
MPIDSELKFNSRRSAVYSTGGMVATSQPLAVAAGLEILRRGGNAADAAVAVAAALNVTEPTSTGLGGDCFALYYTAAYGQVSALNGSGRSPASLSIDRLAKEGLDERLPQFHPYTITVPGACAGWCDLLEHHGRLPRQTVLSPAIRLAEQGFPVAPITAHHWNSAAPRLRNAPGGLELTIDGRAPREGEIFRNPGLARTLQAIAEGGKAAYYQSEIAEAIAHVVQQAGGCLSVEDLAAHSSTWDSPISTTYHGLRVWECPPNGQGLAALLALNLLEGYDLASLLPLSAQRLHLMIEAMRLAFADTRWYVADPAFNPAPLEWLLSKEYAAERRKLINPDRAEIDQQHGTPTSNSDTVYLSVVDGEGNACSFINSNYMGFGTGIVPSGWGFSLQNRGLGFALDPSHPNALMPGKRPYHTIIPGMITVDSINQSGPRNTLYSSFGVMGGYMQPQGHAQVVVGLWDDKLDPQAALDRPRFCIDDGTPGSKVALEEGISLEMAESLNQLGHSVYTVNGPARALFGRGQVIRHNAETGVLCGGSDPRADGCAMSI